MQEINEALAGNWPNDPDAIYRLACYLTEEEAILAQPATSATSITPKESLPKDAKTTAD